MKPVLECDKRGVLFFSSRLQVFAKWFSITIRLIVKRGMDVLVTDRAVRRRRLSCKWYVQNIESRERERTCNKMQSMEGRLTKIRGNLRTKRKFSLPLFLNYFHQEVVPATSPLDPAAWDSLEDPKLPAGTNDVTYSANSQNGSVTTASSGVSSVASSLRARFGSGNDGSKPVSRQSTRSSSGGKFTNFVSHLYTFNFLICCSGSLSFRCMILLKASLIYLLFFEKLIFLEYFISFEYSIPYILKLVNMIFLKQSMRFSWDNRCGFLETVETVFAKQSMHHM